jgi:SAM-dependent methyltransferase
MQDKSMNISERLLILCCKSGATVEQRVRTSGWCEKNALSLLTEVFPGFLNRIKGKNILDFGCGRGRQCVALASHGAERVVGCDINLLFLEEGEALANEASVSDKIDFVSGLEHIPSGTFDIVLSLNSMEHFKDPLSALREMKRLVCDCGEIYLTFGPPWYAPYGSHMNYFTWLPWVNLLFCEKTVMKIRGRFRNDGANVYSEIEGGLNKMTLAKFDRLISDSGLRVLFRQYDCVKKVNFVSRVPLLKELFVNRVTCVLASSK